MSRASKGGRKKLGDPLRYVCPACGADAGKACRNYLGEQMGESHGRRKWAAGIVAEGKDGTTQGDLFAPPAAADGGGSVDAGPATE